jgi:hypothetical protein
MGLKRAGMANLDSATAPFIRTTEQADAHDADNPHYPELMEYAAQTMKSNEGCEGELLDADTVAQRHAIAPTQLVQLREEDRVAAFPSDASGLLYPAKQFVGNDVIPGIECVRPIIKFEGELWLWLTQPSPYLAAYYRDGGVPLDALKMDRIEEVIAAAHRQYDPL